MTDAPGPAPGRPGITPPSKVGLRALPGWDPVGCTAHSRVRGASGGGVQLVWDAAPCCCAVPPPPLLLQVLFFRGLPTDVRDFEVTPLLAGFCDPASPIKTLVLYGKGQALVEVPSVAVAGVWGRLRVSEGGKRVCDAIFPPAPSPTLALACWCPLPPPPWALQSLYMV